MHYYLPSPMRRPTALLAFLLLACGGEGDGTVRMPQRPPEAPTALEEPPVALNATSPVQYPPALLAQGIEGTVLLKLYVDSMGQLARDSTRIAESSGYPALDSAALATAPTLRFAPAMRDGQPVALTFLQPVVFRSRQGRGVTP